MDWDTLRVVLAIHREGSLAKAASSLKVSSPTVGRQLSRLEETLNAKVFDRFNSGLFITELGQEVLRAAEQMELEMQALQSRMQSVIDPLGGEIRISMPVGMMQDQLAHDIDLFLSLYPNITLKFEETDSLKHPHSRETDIVFRAQDNPSSGLWGYKLDTLAAGYYASEAFMERWGDLIKSSPQTAPVPYIDISAASPADGIRQLLEMLPNAKPIAACNTYDCLLPMVRQGIGLGRMTSYVANNIRGLSKILDCSVANPRAIWVLTHPNLRNDVKIKSFMDFIRTQFERRDEGAENTAAQGED